MKIDRTNFGRLLAVLVAGTLVYAGAAYPQTEKKLINKPGDEPISLHRVTDKSPAADFAAVSKEVSPGMVEVDPNAVSAKRLVLPSGGKVKHFCLGKWITTKAGPTCEGTWLEW